MGHYADPTANAALGDINREFSRLEKKARRLQERYKRGEISDEALERAQQQYTGIYRHVLRRVLTEERKKQEA